MYDETNNKHVIQWCAGSRLVEASNTTQILIVMLDSLLPSALEDNKLDHAASSIQIRGICSACCISKYSLTTLTNSENYPLALNEGSSVLNLLEAIYLNSPRGTAPDFMGSGTTNLPDLSLWWSLLNCSTTIRSSGERTGGIKLWSSIFQNICSDSSVKVEVKQQLSETRHGELPLCTVLVNTHPNVVFIADGDPEGPNRRPWSTVWLTCQLPVVCLRYWVYQILNQANPDVSDASIREQREWGCDDISKIIRGNTKASNASVFPWSMLVTFNFTVPCNVNSDAQPPIPHILTLLCCRGKQRLYAKCFVTNHANRAESNKALAG